MATSDSDADATLTPGSHLVAGRRDVEAPTEDVLEQATPVDPDETDRSMRGRPLAPHDLEVDEADAMEQAQLVGLDDSEYGR